MPVTGFGPGAKFLTAGAYTASSSGGSGVLAALGLSNPIGWIGLGISVGIPLLRRLIFKPKIAPLPVRAVNITGGREVARYVMGERRIKLEWTDATTLPGAAYRDNFKQLIACLSESACHDIVGIWVDEETFEFARAAGDANHYIPTDSDFLLPAGDVTTHRFPTSYAFELRKKFLANGTESASARTDGNPRWAIPSNRQYNGNPGQANWGSEPTVNTTKMRDPRLVCDAGYELDDGVVPPVCRNTFDPTDTDTPREDYTQATITDYALEVKPIDATYKLNGIAWAQMNYFEPFYQSNQPSTKFFRRPPEVDVLMQGILVTTPYSATPVYSDNPMALLHWVDTVYRGIPESRIDAAAYKEAYDHCEEEITYRYGTSAPASSLGSNGEFYARSNGHIYSKSAGAWTDLGEFMGDYAWLSSQGTAGVYKVKRYRYSGELEVGSGRRGCLRSNPRLLRRRAAVRAQGTDSLPSRHQAHGHAGRTRERHMGSGRVPAVAADQEQGEQDVRPDGAVRRERLATGRSSVYGHGCGR